MRLEKVMLSYKSVDWVNFEAGPFTVLFGKNNSGKTNILEGLHGLFDSNANPRREADRGGVMPDGAMCCDLDRGVAFDEAVSAALGVPPTVAEPGRVAFTSPGSARTVAADWGDFNTVQAYMMWSIAPAFESFGGGEG